MASLEFYKGPITWNHKEVGEFQGKKPGSKEGIVEEVTSERGLQGWTVRTSQGCIKRQIMASVGEDVETWIPHALLVGMQNDTSALENSLAGRQKVEHRATA